MKIILDCNIWISFLIGHQAEWMKRILTDVRFDIFVCDELLDEISDVISRPKIRSRVNDDEIEDFFRILYAFCRVAKIDHDAQVPVRDPQDLYLLSLAESVEAELIVSGDADLISLKQHKSARMMTIASFKTLVQG
ncbi:MAG: putative toxin-antitoxin system toxin component, PIN family [Bacteroidales bacterium]|nr:putative toxin-antitoxin system toxin component, PIN family [Bacteroidales bacterium]